MSSRMITISVRSPPPMYIFNPPWLPTGQQRRNRRNGYGLSLGWGARGDVAEWLGRGLQSLVHRFESGRRLFPAVDGASVFTP